MTPEKTIVTYQLARVGSRLGAHLIDLFIVGCVYGGVMTFITIVAGASGSQDVQGFATWFALVSPLLLIFGYFILFEALNNGQTLGKKAVGIRVRMSDGTPITPRAALARNLIRPADMVPGTYFVGLLAMFTNPRSQRIGDFVAGTIVVHEKRNYVTYVPSPYKAGIHAMEDSVGELRGMTMDEYVAVKRFCDRFPELPQRVQDQLIREVWNPIARRRGIPSVPNVHPLYLAEATVMKYGREHALL